MAYTEAQKRATLKYKRAAYKRIPLDVRVEEYEAFREYCERHGVSVNGAIRDFMKRCVEGK